MNKKKNLLALALSVSFVLGANSISYAEEDINQIPQAKEETQNLDKTVNELVVEDKEQEEVPATDKAVENLEEEKTTPVDASNKENESLQVSDAVNPENVGAIEADLPAQALDTADPNDRVQEPTDTNYSKDEKGIKDYSGSERYKETDLEPGNTNQEFDKTDAKVEKDGFKFELSNPSETSPSKTKYGY